MMDIFRRETKYIFESLFEFILVLLVTVPWIAGVVLAKAGWLKVLAVVLPMYSWYLVIKKAMIINGLI